MEYKLKRSGKSCEEKSGYNRRLFEKRKLLFLSLLLKPPGCYKEDAHNILFSHYKQILQFNSTSYPRFSKAFEINMYNHIKNNS